MNQMNETTKAWKFYSRALMSDFHWVPAHNNRGALFFDQGDYGAAEREFSIAIQLEPDNATLRFNRGVSRFEQEMYMECLLDISAANQLGNQSWETRYISGMCKGRMKEYSTATAILKSLALDQGLDRKTSSLVWNNMGVMQHRADNLETARRCFSEAVSEDPLNDLAQANLGKIESTMSGAELQATGEEPLKISPRRTTSNVLGLTPSDFLNTVNTAATLFSIAGYD